MDAFRWLFGTNKPVEASVPSSTKKTETPLEFKVNALVKQVMNRQGVPPVRVFEKAETLLRALENKTGIGSQKDTFQAQLLFARDDLLQNSDRIDWKKFSNEALTAMLSDSSLASSDFEIAFNELLSRADAAPLSFEAIERISSVVGSKKLERLEMLITRIDPDDLAAIIKLEGRDKEFVTKLFLKAFDALSKDQQVKFVNSSKDDALQLLGPERILKADKEKFLAEFRKNITLGRVALGCLHEDLEKFYSLAKRHRDGDSVGVFNEFQARVPSNWNTALDCHKTFTDYCIVAISNNINIEESIPESDKPFTMPFIEAIKK